ncbi:MAG: DNA replication protein [Alphaproteobacteria bacterium]
MSEAAQLALDLGYRPALEADDFLVAPTNEEAVGWLDRWPDWPGPGLVVYGPAGCGKTHLAHVWRAKSGACFVEAGAVRAGDPAVLLGSARGAVVEDVEEGVDEPALLHLYNALVARGGHLLLTGRRPPARWTVHLPDLRSRLVALPAVAVLPPDDPLIAAVLLKQFADRQLRVDPEVLTFLVARMERSFEAARRVVDALDHAALAERRNITVPLARRVLKETDRGQRE